MGGEEPPADFALLLDTSAAANLLGVCEKTIYTMYTTGQMPEPIRIGRLVRFGSRELAAWIDAGCPPRDEWVWPALAAPTRGT